MFRNRSGTADAEPHPQLRPLGPLHPTAAAAAVHHCGVESRGGGGEARVSKEEEEEEAVELARV